MEKTNVIRLLEQNKISFSAFEYDDTVTEGVVIAKMLAEPTEQVFKTLVTVGASKRNYVFVIPVAETLDLKKVAKLVGEKSVDMIKQKELLPLTGYIHGGCSPIGMKKLFRTYIDESAQNFDKIFVSAGRVGRQVCLSPIDLAKFVKAQFSSLTVTE